MSASEGTRIAHYELLERVGAGAMGVVWKAKDTRLMRVVALKSVTSAKAGDAIYRSRLIQEARAASQLDHPNICSIHQVEELPDEAIVVVMAFYEGETLAERLRRGPLDPETAVGHAMQILSGLDHAHERGVIHRDLKPANLILCNSGVLKIVDFGLAKRNGGEETLTETGGMVGTLSYMSPEQVLCKKLDHRTDLWACGVVLYEMISGELPFVSESAYGVLQAILQTRQRGLHDRVSGDWSHLHMVIERALDKELQRRFQSAAEFMEALQPAPQAGLERAVQSLVPFQDARLDVAAMDRSVAVLPFTGAEDDDETQDFCDGLTDEIITGLSSVQSIRTICSTSAMRLKDSTNPIRRIAEELGVRYVLRGTVRLGNSPRADTSSTTAGRAIRVTAQLIDPQGDVIVWGDKYRGTIEDVFEIQETISRQIVATLKVTLSPKEDKLLEARPLQDVRAVQFYVRAKQEILNYSSEGLERALEYLQMGEKVVGSNALLLSAQGQVYWQYVNAGISADPAYLVKAKHCASEAAKLDPESAHVLRLQGLISLQEGKTQEAVLLLKRSIAVDANDSDSLSWYSAVCGISGKAHAAMPLARRILEIDPLTPVYRFVPGLMSMMAGEFEDAIPSLDEAIRLDPRNAMLLWLRGQTLALGGRTEDAVLQLQALQIHCGDHYFNQFGSVMTAALRGDTTSTMQKIDASFEEITKADAHYSWALGECYSLVGQPELAIVWLWRAIDKGFINYPMIGRWDPLLAGVRRHAQFGSLLQQVRQRWEKFEV